MIPYAFRYHRPQTLSDAENLFAQAGDARYLAGGQTLIPAMKQRLANPTDLIDLSRLGLDFVRKGDGTVVIGASTCHADIASSALVNASVPALTMLAGSIGDPAVRHRGTLGGSLANNDPAADYPAAALGLGAAIRTRRRVIESEDFFIGLFETALEAGEIVTEVAFRVPQRAGYAKFRNPASGYAIVGVFVAQIDGRARVAVTGAGAHAFRVPEMEEALTRRFAPDAVAEVSVAADRLNADLHASAEYRAHLVTVMAKRAVAAAISSAEDPP